VKCAGSDSSTKSVHVVARPEAGAVNRRGSAASSAPSARGQVLGMLAALVADREHVAPDLVDETAPARSPSQISRRSPRGCCRRSSSPGGRRGDVAVGVDQDLGLDHPQAVHREAAARMSSSDIAARTPGSVLPDDPRLLQEGADPPDTLVVGSQSPSRLMNSWPAPPRRRAGCRRPRRGRLAGQLEGDVEPHRVLERRELFQRVGVEGGDGGVQSPAGGGGAPCGPDDRPAGSSGHGPLPGAAWPRSRCAARRRRRSRR